MKRPFNVPTGSTLVATLGDKTVTGVSVDGKCVLNLNKPGTWAVTATLDGASITKDVFVPYGEWNKEYMLHPYEQIINYTMLYDYGDECTDVTGGWYGREHGSGTASSIKYVPFTKNAANMQYNETISSPYIFANICSQTSFLTNDNTKLHVRYTDNSTVSNQIDEDNTAFMLYNSGSEILPAFKLGQGNVTAEINILTPKILTWDISDVNDFNELRYAIRTTAVGFNLYLNHTVHAVFMTKEDDWQELCSVAGVSASTDLETLIADTTKLAGIFNNRNAVLYMVYNCTGDFMASVIKNATALAQLAESPYYTIVQANEHWAKFLAMVA